MAFFNRKNKGSVLPEIDKYYDGERRDRAGLAWLLALISVISVTLVVVGVFVGGRWAYRQITNRNNDKVAVVENGDEEIIPDFDGAITPSEDSNKSQDSEDKNKEDSSSNNSEGEDEEGAEDSGQVDAPARTDTPSGPVAQVPVTGDNPLPGTGPANVAGLFVVVTAVAGGAHYTLTRKRQS